VSLDESKFNATINDGIRKTVNKFREYPGIFFSEMDLHSYLYYCLYSTKFEAKTTDGVVTSCLHKEYPTNFRYSKFTMEDYGLSNKGVRRHFDLAILNPQFIQKSKLSTVANKEVKNVAEFKNIRVIMRDKKIFLEKVKS
jgi:hypothetical protein